MNGRALGSAAQNLLEQFAAELAKIDGFEVPASQYVASGLVSWDGESLTVRLGSIDQGQPGAPFGGTYVGVVATQLWATFYVQILRETAGLTGEGFAPDMTPSPDVLDVYGQTALSDAGALAQAAIAVHAAYSVTGAGEGFVVGPVTPLGPDGGISGMQLAVHVSLT